MATAILRPQDCHKLRFLPETLTSPPFKPLWNPTRNRTRSRRSKRNPIGFQDNLRDRVRDRSMVVKFPAKNLVMGHVKILKRGEELKPVKDRRPGVICAGGSFQTAGFVNEDELVLCSTDRLGPEPETVQKQIRVSEYKVADGVYAGLAFFASPPPSSVPFPAFFAKEKKNDAATSDIRRLLRLDLL